MCIHEFFEQTIFALICFDVGSSQFFLPQKRMFDATKLPRREKIENCITN